MKIAIIGAMAQEIKYLCHYLINVICWQQAQCKFYQGELYNSIILIVETGIGKVAAAIGTTIVLNSFQPKLIINVGYSGSLISNLKIGNIVVSNSVAYHDVNMTAFNYKIGQIAKCPKIFKIPSFIIKLIKSISKNCNIFMLYGLIVSGDIFVNKITDLTKIIHNFPKAIAVDMESASIAQVCYRFNVAFVNIRVISDLINNNSYNQFHKHKIFIADKFTVLIKEIIKQINI